MKIVRAGPRTTYVDVRRAPSVETSAHVGRLARALTTLRPAGVDDVVAGFTTLAIEHAAGTTAADVDRWIERAGAGSDARVDPRHHEIPVSYGAGADEAELSSTIARPFSEIADLHAAHVATVAFVGFTPGFPYMLGLPEALHLPRRRTPVHRIEAGTVAIADGRTGIYPSASPGGWWALGTTSVTIFDPDADEPALFGPGDTVSFVPTQADDEARPVRDRRGQASFADGARPVLEIVDAVPGSASLQGPARTWVGRYGVASGGVLDVASWEAMHDRIDIGREGVVLEVLGQPLVARARSTVTALVGGGGARIRIGTTEVDAWRPFQWERGRELRLEPSQSVPGRVTMIALSGGFSVPSWLGSGSTDVRAGAGGGYGRWLRRGDLLHGAATDGRPSTASPSLRPTYPDLVHLRIHPGPQIEHDAWDALTSGTFRVGAFDRTGVRLEGPEIAMERHEVVSEGAPLGAVQIPPDGQPIVLLADRGRTGGYAKPAVVDRRDLGRLAQATPATAIRFVPARSRP